MNGWVVNMNHGSQGAHNERSRRVKRTSVVALAATQFQRLGGWVSVVVLVVWSVNYVSISDIW